MTIEHKLQHFEELCIHSAQEAGEKMTADYTAYLGIWSLGIMRKMSENRQKQGSRRKQKPYKGKPINGWPSIRSV